MERTLWRAGLLALGGWGVVRADDPCRRALLPDVQQERAIVRARGLTMTPFAAQSANGTVLDQTVWEHHFRLSPLEGAKKEETPPADLHAMGRNHLDRLARRTRDAGAGAVLRLYVQRARLGDGGTAADLDAKRLATIRLYLADAWPDIAYTVAIHDPAAVGMPAIEAVAALKNHQGTALGYIPEGFRAVQSSSKADGQGQAPAGGVLPKPEPVSVSGSGASGALGAGSSGGGSQ